MDMLNHHRKITVLTITLLLLANVVAGSKVFYKLHDKYLNGHVIKVMYVDEPTECVGMCMHMGKCVAFNVEEAKDGAHMCEFLSDNRCGFVDHKKDSVMFTSHKTCTFQIRQKTNWRCIAKTESGFLREATDSDSCVDFQLNLDGTGFKIDGKCIAVKKENGPNEVDWLVTSSFDDDTKCQVHFSGTDSQFQITEISSQKCVSTFKYDVHTYLVLDKCGKTNFKMRWNHTAGEDTTEELVRQHVIYPFVVPTWVPALQGVPHEAPQAEKPQPDSSEPYVD